MAESEVSVLRQQCLDCRIPDEATLRETSLPGNARTTRSKRLLIGTLLSPMRAKNSNDSIPHFHHAGVRAHNRVEASL
jgi:hypothetical protein